MWAISIVQIVSTQSSLLSPEKFVASTFVNRHSKPSASCRAIVLPFRTTAGPTSEFNHACSSAMIFSTNSQSLTESTSMAAWAKGMITAPALNPRRFEILSRASVKDRRPMR